MEKSGIWLEYMALGEWSGHEAGRRLLAALYEKAAGGPMPPIVERPGEKPRFLEGPWHFSVTHTKKHAFCALARFPVGIDAEEADRPVKEALAERILSPGELAQYRQAPDPRRALLTFWVLKEAAGKLSGRGLRGDLRATNFSLEDPRVTERAGCLLAVLSDQEEGYAV